MNIQANLAHSRSEEGRNGTIRQTEFECHACGRMIYADIDISINGNHIIICPCGHEHCRVVRNGRITSSRWSSRNGEIASTVYASTTSSTSNLFYDNYNSSTYTSCSGTWYIC